VRVVIARGCRNPGSHPASCSPEILSAYADLQPDAATPDIDWNANEFDCIAEQTLGGSRSF